jgi:hypothetical protein
MLIEEFPQQATNFIHMWISVFQKYRPIGAIKEFFVNFFGVLCKLANAQHKLQQSLTSHIKFL